ncbi:MAG: hypothetical protein ACLT0Y_02275 [Christensenellales bacterium]
MRTLSPLEMVMIDDVMGEYFGIEGTQEERTEKKNVQKNVVQKESSREKTKTEEEELLEKMDTMNVNLILEIVGSSNISLSMEAEVEVVKKLGDLSQKEVEEDKEERLLKQIGRLLEHLEKNGMPAEQILELIKAICK